MLGIGEALGKVALERLTAILWIQKVPMLKHSVRLSRRDTICLYLYSQKGRGDETKGGTHRK